MSKINVNQIDQAGLSLFVQQASSGSAFSGNFTNFVASSGWIGPTALWITGGNQTVLGSKTFTGAIGVPYSGTTGQTVARLYVDNNINLVSGYAQTGINNSNNGLSGFLSSGLTATGATLGASLFATGSVLSAVKITGSSVIQVANFTGLGGTLIIYSGSQIFISGASASAGGITQGQLDALSGYIVAGLTNTGALLSAVKVTGSSVIPIANFTGLGGTLVIYSGNQIFISGAAGGAVGTTVNDPMYVTGNQLVSGLKRFVSGIEVLNSTSPSGVTNFAYLSGVSGVLNSLINTMTGYIQNNTFNITGTGTTNLTVNNSGTTNNTFNIISGTLNANSVISIGVITGNFVDVSFFLDPIATGLNLFEAHIAHGFTFTGAAFSCRTSGFGPVTGGGAAMSGKIYQVDSNNTEQTLYSFIFQSGLIYSGSPTFNIYVTGRNRVGLSISNSLSGIEKFAVGVFGGTYA